MIRPLTVNQLCRASLCEFTKPDSPTVGHHQVSPQCRRISSPSRTQARLHRFGIHYHLGISLIFDAFLAGIVPPAEGFPNWCHIFVTEEMCLLTSHRCMRLPIIIAIGEETQHAWTRNMHVVIRGDGHEICKYARVMSRPRLRVHAQVRHPLGILAWVQQAPTIHDLYRRPRCGCETLWIDTIEIPKRVTGTRRVLGASWPESWPEVQIGLFDRTIRRSPHLLVDVDDASFD